MKNYSFYLIIVVFFNYFICNVFAENNYYIVSIRKSPNAHEYDKAPEQEQNSLDELVNDRMNDIHEIIIDNNKTYVLENGKLDEKVENELAMTSQLKKRSFFNETMETENKKYKYIFMNSHRSQKYFKKFKRSMPVTPQMENSDNSDNSDNIDTSNTFNTFNNTTTTTSGTTTNSLEKEGEQYVDEDIEYIPFESNLVIHVCPILNYYAVIAYLSEPIVNEIQKLPNVIRVERSFSTAELHTIDYKASTKYYNVEDILKETHWKNVEVQEYPFNFDLKNSHLSLLSQGKYSDSSDSIYDNNYYYPSSAGKGIDIYVIDRGLDISLSKENFDRYEGTEDERTITCEGVFSESKFRKTTQVSDCDTTGEKHGTFVSIASMGKINGAAKKANLHFLDTGLEIFDELAAMDYVKQKATPGKTVINVSRGCNYDDNCFSIDMQNKIKEMVDSGYIIFVAMGNSYKYNCNHQHYNSYEGVIPIAAINNRYVGVNEKLEKMYERASYSSFGDCVALFAPGAIQFSKDSLEDVMYSDYGTSFASPIVAGVAATLMSEDSETQYNFESMKNKLIDLSLKDVLHGLDDTTPNRLVNNGKHSNVNLPRCDDPSGLYHCQDQCCSKFGHCVDNTITYSTSSKLCLFENDCNPDFGQCTSQKCNNKYGKVKCSEDECCSAKGECVKILNDYDGSCFLENGCTSEFSGQCLSYDLKQIEKYDKKYHDTILHYTCKKELQPYKACDYNFNFVAQDLKALHQRCDAYRESNCKEFFKDPYKYAPTCKKTIQTHKYSLLNEKDDAMMTVRSTERNFVCARENPQSSNEICQVSKSKLSKKHLNMTFDEATSLACGHEECYESLLAYTKAYFTYYQNLEPTENNEKQVQYYKTKIDDLMSEECINKNSTIMN